jgi:hypothetical protein
MPDPKNMTLPELLERASKIGRTAHTEESSLYWIRQAADRLDAGDWSEPGATTRSTSPSTSATCSSGAVAASPR